MPEDRQSLLQGHLKTIAIALGVVGTIAVPFIYIGQTYVGQAIAAHEDVIQEKFVTREELAQSLQSMNEKLADNGKKLDKLTEFVAFIRETQIGIKTTVDALK